jgi:histidinol-phosphate phosphatase family protein
MQAVILAGGAGTRLSHVTGQLPKALIEIAGKPLLHRQLELIARHGFDRVLLLVKHGADYIRASCGDGTAWGISIEYVEEAQPLGTAGALLAAFEQLQDRFLVLYGDTVLNVDLGRMWAEHCKREADATLFVHPNDHPYDSDIVEASSQDRVIAVHPYPHPPGRDLPNLVNAALYVIDKNCLGKVPGQSASVDLAKHFFPDLLRDGKYLTAYRSREYIKDAGTAERLAAVRADVISGRVSRGSLMTPAAAVFLDQDGTLIDHPGYIADPDQVRLFPGVSDAIRRLNRSEYLSIVVTNQPAVARGEIDEHGLKLIHNRLEQTLGRDRAYLEGIYYCPHHPDKGFAGENLNYKINCTCRKPAVGLAERAATEMNIDLGRSWVIGDTTTDLEMARRAGIRSVLVGTGQSGQDGRYPQRPDFEFSDLSAAVSFILDRWPSVESKAAAIASQVHAGDLIVIGGLARSGKSVFASALAHAIRRAGISAAKVISLDGWIKPLDQRNDGSVLDRFDMSKIEADFGAAIARGGDIAAAVYDRRRRGPGKTYSVAIGAGDTIILEGVVALLVDLPLAHRMVRVYVHRDEASRYKTMAMDYRARGFTEEQFARLHAERQIDESPIIRDTRSKADFLVELE